MTIDPDTYRQFREAVTMTASELEKWLATDDDAHMRKVVGYVHRHLAQRPQGDVTDTRWRYSPMNWGYDPLKG